MRSYLQNNLRLCALSFVLLLTAGCVTAPQPYDYSALERNRPRSILVIPPINNSIEVNASYIFLASVSRPLAEKGYYVFPVAVIDRFLKENGLPSPGEMNAVPLDKFRDITGADAVLFVTIEDWGQKYQLLTSVTVVHADLRLVDTRTGDLLWEASARARVASDDADMGLLGAIVNALATQIARSISDTTFPVAQRANYFVVHHPSMGLLQGPYFNPEAEQYFSAPVSAQNSAEKIELGDETDLIHVGVAASEITAKTYSPDLWIKALALAGGDAEKQKGIYIKLRSGQLAEEKEKREKLEQKVGINAELTKQEGREPIEILGVYKSVVKSNKGKESQSVVFLARSGNEIRGKFIPDRGDRITGTLQNDKIRFHWTFADSTYDRVGTWKLKDSRNDRLEGAWEDEGNTTGTWKLSKTGSGKATDIEGLTFPVSKSISQSPIVYLGGTYNSKISGSYRATDAVEIEQSGNKVTGISANKEWEFEGVLEGNVVNFKWYSPANKGKGKFTVDSRGNLIGAYTGDSWGEGKWILKKFR